MDRRRRWHPDCVDAYNASDPRELRRQVRKRDRGICRICRVDTNRVRREVQGAGRARKLRELGFQPRRSLWELDHVVPLIDGGGHGADNLQTLCVPCHRRKTAEEARARAEQRRDAVALSSTEPEVPPGAPKPAVAPRETPPEPKGLHRELDELLARADVANARVEALLARD